MGSPSAMGELLPFRQDGDNGGLFESDRVVRRNLLNCCGPTLILQDSVSARRSL